MSSSVVVMFILFCVNPSFVVIPQYVPQNLYPVYKNKVVPVADIITPNQFEAEWVQSFCFVDLIFLFYINVELFASILDCWQEKPSAQRRMP